MTGKLKAPKKPALLQSRSRQSLGEQLRGALFHSAYSLAAPARPKPKRRRPDAIGRKRPLPVG